MPRRASPPSQPDPDLATVAAALADRSRVAMLDTLLDGRGHPIGRLARLAGVSPATASSHLRQLVASRLVAVTAVGRERHVRLASPEVAEVLERLAALAAPAERLTSPSQLRARELRFARTCYDHLAGKLAIAVARALIDRGWLVEDPPFSATPALVAWLAAHGHTLDIATRRPQCRPCLDWSERVPHVAGQIGAAIAEVALADGWVVRVRNTRALRVTERGARALQRELGVAVPRA
ncbi:MAG: helix-turn-helix domain-containing protein [Deltaproteobacteria bacterium]|nr:helix-turn-helix domain-containing protein [Deltaproteobacteria bacterium]